MACARIHSITQQILVFFYCFHLLNQPKRNVPKKCASDRFVIELSNEYYSFCKKCSRNSNLSYHFKKERNPNSRQLKTKLGNHEQLEPFNFCSFSVKYKTHNKTPNQSQILIFLHQNKVQIKRFFSILKKNIAFRLQYVNLLFMFELNSTLITTFAQSSKSTLSPIRCGLPLKCNCICWFLSQVRGYNFFSFFVAVQKMK